MTGLPMRRGDRRDPGHPIDFFISYSPADERWAAWIGWQLEAAGYRTLIQAWDFVPGSTFIDFMDRGVRHAAVVVAVLSRSYLTSRYGTMEWQAALRTDPGKLVTIRVEDCPLEGLLATITYLDLVGISDSRVAAETLLDKLRQVLVGRAKPAREPDFPARQIIQGDVVHPGGPAAPAEPDAYRPASPAAPARRVPVAAPGFPPEVRSASHRRDGISVLHVAGPRFGRGMAGPDEPQTARELQARIQANVARLTGTGVPTPDLVVVSGDLTESARPRQIEEAWTFLAGLRVLLGLEAHRLVVVPGARDVSKPACLSYFAACEARDDTPREPYYPKLELFAELFADLYQGLDEPVFDSSQPWTLFAVPELRVVLAALNSTMAISHRPEDNYGRLGEAQAAWFAERLRPFEESGWLRVGVLRHDPLPGASAGEDPALLRDAGTLEGLLGNRLNLLLHGPGPGGTRIDHLGPQLPVLPAAAPGRDEIIHLTADGLRRFSAHHTHPGEATERLNREWHAAGSTFAVSRPEFAPELVEEDSVPALAVVAHDPQSLLLARIADVCAASYPGARIRRVDTAPPHLLLTRQEEGFTLQRRVGAHVGELSADVVEDFLSHDLTDGSELVYQGPAPSEVLREQAARRRVRLRSFTEFQGLLDLADYVSGQTLRLRADRFYPPDLYVPQRFRELGRDDRSVRDDLAQELMALVTADHGRFVLVLGDFGRGKSFALREVARRIAETTPLIPILIELGALDRSHSVDGLVAAHLAQHGENRIDLRAFHYMLREGRIVLLFDGFDELVTRISYERAADHLDSLLHAVRDKAKIIVSSRTQHFKSQAQVFTALGERVGRLPQRRILSIEDFTSAQIRACLVNRYDGDEQRADARFRLLSGIKDLLGLASNPRMLSFIADLDEERLRAAARSQHTVSAAALYQEILESWLSHETQRATGGPGAAPGLGMDDLWEAVTTLAVALWETGEPYLRPAQLAEVADTLSSLAASRLSPHQRVHAMGAGSLLVRTEEGLFGFIHASVMEWLVAHAIAGQLTSGAAAPAHLTRRPLTQLTIDFLCDIAEPRACQAWADSVLTDADADDVARTNALKVRTRLDTPATADLRGADLRGQDLSYRELSDVDLSGADLTGTSLVGANLSRAVLRDARLVGARLDEARLSGADLRGADLTRARLSRADLTGATLTGSRWARAALIDVTGVPDAPELRAAAVAPGSPVETELAPAAIGVRHGFHAEMGRLPQVLAYSPDGGTLAIGSDDGGVLVCDTATGRPLRTLQGHRGRVFAVAYGSDVLVTGSSDGTVRLWDAATGTQLCMLEGHQDWPWPVVLGPSGELLATGDSRGALRLWNIAPGNVASGTLRHEIASADGFVFSLAFHGTLLAAAYRNGNVRLWDTASGAAAGELTGATGSVYQVAFSPAGDLLITGGQGGAVRGWDPSTGEQVWELRGHTGGVYALTFHPTEPLLASGDTDGGVRVWDTTSGELRHALTGHAASIYCVAFSPSGDVLATGDSAGVVQLWETRSGRLRHVLTEHTGSVWPFAFRPDGAQLAISDDQFTTRLWDPAIGLCRHAMTGHGRQVSAVRFSADGALLATSGNDGAVRLWDPATGRQLRRLAGSPDRLLIMETAVFHPSRPLLAMVSNDGRLNLLNLSSDRYERHLNVESSPIWAVAFSPSGEELATANDDDTVRVWYRTTGRLVHTLAEHRGRVRSIAFSDDGSVIATGCDDSLVRLWDAATGTLLRTLHGHTDRVYAVAFGRGLLASASWDTTARVWDVGTGRTRHVLTRHTGRLRTAAFTPSGDLLATAGDDLVIRLWDPTSGAHLQTLTGHSRGVWSVTFNPAGDLLASGGDGGTARLWSVADGRATIRMTLLGLPHGWAALAPDGRYKIDGDVAGQFWHVIGMCRFETGELDQSLPEIRQLPPDTPF